MRIFRKERQPRANTRALASFAGRLVEVVLTIIDLVVEGAPETDDVARGSQQQERAARTGQRLCAHSISRSPAGAVLATVGNFLFRRPYRFQRNLILILTLKVTRSLITKAYGS